jgi:hypothetical protein
VYLITGYHENLLILHGPILPKPVEAVNNAAEAALRRMRDSVANLLTGISRDIQAAELWRDDIMGKPDDNTGKRDFFSIEEQSDTILRQAIGDPELVEAVGQVNRQERDKKLEEIGNLWRWRERPAQDAVLAALRTYARGGAAAPPTGQKPGAAATAQQQPPAAPPAGPQPVASSSPPPTLIWHWLEETVKRVAGRFVQKDTYKHNIESYIAHHPRSVEAGVEPDGGSFAGDSSDAYNYLIDMGYLAKPYIFLEEVELTQPVVAIDLLGVNREDRTRFNRQFVGDLRADHRWSTHPPRITTTHDPFSLTYLRTLHGLPARSMSRWVRYRDSFANLERRDRGLLEVLPTSAYKASADKNPSLRSRNSLFFGFAEEVTSGNGQAVPAGQ